MAEDKDYDLVMYKVPRKDKQGNDVTGDKLGKGGRHRKDGTYSAVAYDPEIVGKDNPIEKSYEDFPWYQQLLIDVADIITTNAADYLTDKAIAAFEQWQQNKRKKEKSQNKPKYKKSSDIMTRKTKAEQILREEHDKNNCAMKVSTKKEAASATEDFDNAYQYYAVNMTSEEAQKELLDIFMLSVIRAKKLWKLSHANIVGTDGASDQFIKGKAIMERLSNANVIGNINSILEENPMLLEEWELIALSNILGRELIVDKEYVPIGDNEFRKALTSLVK